MDDSRKDFIYDRLNALSMKIEPNSIPNPHYISEKLVQCHICFEEVEKYFIEVSKQISILQRALNNSESSYASKKDNLISEHPEIRNLPSIKDKEARANTHLKEQLNEIRTYKNELADLEKLESVLTYKTKTLTRNNYDIKLQLRIMESQLKLGTGSIDDKHSREIMDELKKSMNGQDAWEDAKSTCEEMTIIDPSKTIDAESLGLTEQTAINNPTIRYTMDLGSEEPIQDLSNDPSFFNQSEPVINNPTIQEDAPKVEETKADYNNLLKDSVPELTTAEVQPEEEIEEEIEEDPLKFSDDDLLGSSDITVEEDKTEEQPLGIDLDKILEISTPTGGTKEPEKEKEKESETKVTQEEKPKDPSTTFDFSDLLSQFN